MTISETSRHTRYVRLRTDLLLEVRDGDALTGGALRQIARDEHVDPAERAQSELAVKQDTAEALAYLIDPYDLVKDVPGVDLARASWSSEAFAEGAGGRRGDDPYDELDPEGSDWFEDDDDEEGEDAGGALR
ncbi:hypothetical protein ACSMX9_19245 [Streptomyces sp. LE64]|uniref:hypothetical protein n=1 Tax=unclassified Streptomyces TaxID=2593676 RepID=UPI003323E41A